jgi:glycine cleavage system P protein (glycine dehydrogenase) subunit 1
VRFAPHTDDDVREMLSACGLSSLDELFAHLPEKVTLDRELALPEGVSEIELVNDLRRLAGRNQHVDDVVCFAGGGAYDHYIPAVVWALAGRSELYTSYTPYQPELSQGILQSLFEYQSMICELTGLEVSNASLYDGPTALVEAVHMATGATRRERVLVSGEMDQRYIETLRTYGAGEHYSIELLESDGGVTLFHHDERDIEDVAAVVYQHPNKWGNLDPPVSGAAHESGARVIQVFDPLSLGVLKSPAELGADIAVAEGQSLGNHLNYGGPYLGIIAARMQDVRRMPGRIAGETTDVDGKRGFVLTLQAREQHIRREKATSNICTNQTLMAVAAAVYLSWLGPEGLRGLGEQCVAKSHYMAERLSNISGVGLMWPEEEFFKEFALSFPEGRSVRDVQSRLLQSGFLVGPEVSQSPGLPQGLLISVTERRTREEIDRFVKAFEEAVT